MIFSIPAAIFVHKFGFTKSLTLAMLLCTIGLWMNYMEIVDIGLFIQSLSLPFISVSMTAISGRWYGPRGRTITISFSLIVQHLSLMKFRFLNYTDTSIFVFCILSTIMIPIVLFVFSDKPSKCPTLSEEVKQRIILNPRESLKSIWIQLNYKYFVLVSGFLMLNIYFQN